LAKLIAIAVLMALVAGCGSKEDSQTAAPAPQPTATLNPGDEGVEEEYN
jgi:nitrous oxide reductase accessory protein NosL